jgi:glycosyltransferase involved in cell wall biosynthesis
MKVFYAHNRPFPSRFVNTINVARMCGAFSQRGLDVTLIHPESETLASAQLIRDHYGVQGDFQTIAVPAGTWFGRKRWRTLSSTALALSASIVVATEPQPSVIYCRSKPLALALALLLHPRPSAKRCRGVFLELHNYEGVRPGLLRRLTGIVVTTEALRDKLKTAHGVPDPKILVAPNAIDLTHRSSAGLGKREARQDIGIDPNTRLVAYAGTLNRLKGLTTIFECARRLKDDGVHFLLAGQFSKERDRETLQRLSDSGQAHLRYEGYVEPGSVSRYLDASDILILPPTQELEYADYHSPLKMYEYMAARRPIVASSLPVLGEALQHERNALLVPAEDTEAWCAAIRRLLADRTLAERLAEQAYRDVSRRTWDQRATRVAAFIEGRI